MTERQTGRVVAIESWAVFYARRDGDGMLVKLGRAAVRVMRGDLVSFVVDREIPGALAYGHDAFVVERPAGARPLRPKPRRKRCRPDGRYYG
jgi:hypothetical protein